MALRAGTGAAPATTSFAMNRPLRLLAGTGTLAAGAVLLTPALASAHIEPNVSEVPASEPVTVAFNLEHGCDGAPTTQLDMQIPEDITDAQPVDKEGWTGSVADGVVTFAGGSQPGDQDTDFSITFTAPDTPGIELRFPIVQTCGTTEVAWIEESEDDELPAPVVMVGEGGSAPVTAGEHDDEGGDEEATTTTASGTSDEEAAADSDDDDSSVAPWLIGGAVVVIVVGGGIYLLRPRSAT